MKVIDVHCHIVPADFPATPPTCAPEKWPRMEDRGSGQRHVGMQPRAGNERRASRQIRDRAS